MHMLFRDTFSGLMRSGARYTVAAACRLHAIGHSTCICCLVIRLPCSCDRALGMHMCHVFSIHDEYVVYIIFMLLLCRRVFLLLYLSHCPRELYVAVLFFFLTQALAHHAGRGLSLSRNCFSALSI